MTDEISKRFQTDGYLACDGILAAETVGRIKAGIFEIMRPYLSNETKALGPDRGLDAGFDEISAAGPKVKSHCYRLWGKLSSLPLVLGDPAVQEKVKALGFEHATIQSYSIFCLENGNRRNAFLPHQDLRDRTSLNSLLIWIPLSQGDNIGGMSVYPGTHRDGPLHHDLSAEGKPFVPEATYKDRPRKDIVDFKVGDCIFMSPYAIHESIENRGASMRWTAVVKLDSAIELTHLKESLSPFDIERFIDLRLNSERLVG